MSRYGVGVLVLLGLLSSSPFVYLRAQTSSITAYKCTAASGDVSYQAAPCQADQHQKTVQLEDNEPGTPNEQASSDDTTPAAATPAPPLVPVLPRTPPTTMFRCTRATDGKTYLSDNGNPQPYYAPLAMTGILPTPLGQIAPGRVSANAAMVASHYTQVQDQCQAMAPEDTCSELRSQYDDNEKKLSRAFKSDLPPLLQRERELMAQLSHC